MFRAMLKTFLVALAAAVWAGGAWAATTVNFYNDPSNPGTLRGTLTCSESCEGLLAPAPSATWSSTMGQMFPRMGTGGSLATETALAQTLSGLPLSGAAKTNGNGGSMSFDTAGDIILLKLGNGPSKLPYALIRNLFGASQTFTWTQAKGGGSGLSHYDTFTTTAPVPLPASGLLLIAGLGGLGLMGRRRKAA